MDGQILYKLVPAADVPEDAWRTRLQWTTAFVGKQSTSFIHLLTGEQLAGAAAASFAGKTDVMLLSFAVERMVEEADLKVKMEAAEAASGGSGAFAHVYGGAIPYACLQFAPALLTIADGKHVFPPPVGAAVAPAADSNVGAADGDTRGDAGVYYSSEDDGYEGEAATGMYG